MNLGSISYLSTNICKKFDATIDICNFSLKDIVFKRFCSLCWQFFIFIFIFFTSNAFQAELDDVSVQISNCRHISMY